MIYTRTIRLLGAASALTLAGFAPATAQELRLDTILVTPNRTPTEASKVGSKVETVTSEEIEQRALPLVVDYLTLLPGVSTSSSGGLGQETGLFVRGADKKYVKTLFNGIDISDPTATQVQSSYEHLIMGGVSGIELLKGSQGTLYGSEAVAGVLGISTLDGIEEGVHHEIFGEFGSNATARGGYKLSGADGTGKAALTLHGLTTDGISSARVNGHPLVDGDPNRLEDDFYRNFTGTFAGEKQVGEYLTLFGSGLLINSEGDFDDSGNPPTDNELNTGKSNQKAARLGATLTLLDGRFRNTVSGQIFEMDREISSAGVFGGFLSPFEGHYLGRRTKIDYQGEFDVADWATLQFGADHERQSAAVTDNFGTDTDDDFDLNGVWTQAVLEPLENLTLTGSVRHDDHSEFGGHTTWRATAAYFLPDYRTKFHGSLGTGFRAPSLYELYAPFAGNPDLDPEESTSFDIGVEQRFFDDRLVADVTFFLLDTRNLIDYSYSTFSYVQIPGTTERRGVEASLTWQAASWLDIGASYTYTHTEQPDGERRPRIPLHDIVLSATVRPAEKWTVSASARGVINVNDRIALAGGAFEDVKLKDHLLVNAKIAYHPTENSELYVRGENLLDQDYETVRGYGTPGISGFAGFRMKF
ncbi:TonB-dependent receptor [Aquamicrobium sp. LC103]|uniref:TonB-dependent receptor plug domain-containing protein n=1 Tax=Aquamicrobium sp. LC103 TaxID=1120658 RepID=UPI00063EC3D8|nr:TonB-dependent receptor [Aquamicrobium sp. LC103]TKT80233.1 TonB-dependent receptor [Aquamicrobium sp. LC103]